MKAVPFADIHVAVKNGDADDILFKVQGKAGHAVLGLNQFVVHDAGQPVDAGDTVADAQHRAELRGIDGTVALLHPLAQ